METRFLFSFLQGVLLTLPLTGFTIIPPPFFLSVSLYHTLSSRYKTYYSTKYLFVKLHSYYTTNLLFVKPYFIEIGNNFLHLFGQGIQELNVGLGFTQALYDPLHGFGEISRVRVNHSHHAPQ